MRYLKRGDPCPLCGQPIQTDSYEDLEVLSCFAWIKENAWLAGIGDPAGTEDEAHDADPD